MMILNSKTAKLGNRIRVVPKRLGNPYILFLRLEICLCGFSLSNCFGTAGIMTNRLTPVRKRAIQNIFYVWMIFVCGNVYFLLEVFFFADL